MTVPPLRAAGLHTAYGRSTRADVLSNWSASVTVYSALPAPRWSSSLVVEDSRVTLLVPRRGERPLELALRRPVVLLERLGALEVEVQVELPGEADPAVHLDRLTAHEARRVAGVRLRRGAGERRIRIARVEAPRRAVDGRARRLGLEQNVGQAVLERLEGADRAAEGLPGLPVGDGHLEEPRHDAEEHRARPHRRDQVDALEQAGRPDQHRRVIEPDLAEALARVERRERRHRERLLHQADAVPRGDEERVGRGGEGDEVLGAAHAPALEARRDARAAGERRLLAGDRDHGLAGGEVGQERVLPARRGEQRGG